MKINYLAETKMLLQVAQIHFKPAHNAAVKLEIKEGHNFQSKKVENWICLHTAFPIDSEIFNLIIHTMKRSD